MRKQFAVIGHPIEHSRSPELHHAFAKKMGIKTIAEFVYSEEVFRKVQSLDIDYSQGFYFSEPRKNIENTQLCFMDKNIKIFS